MYETTYAETGNAFGRIPIVIHLGDFLQLRPTASTSLIDDLHAQREDGSYVHEEVSVEVQHACRLFTSIRTVFELRGTKRFVPGDPLVDFLACMRSGAAFPDDIRTVFEATFATDGTHGIVDPRHSEPGFALDMAWRCIGRLWPDGSLAVLFAMPEH